VTQLTAKIIAIAGGTCSGKSYFAKQAPDSVVVSTDAFYRELAVQVRRQDGSINWEDPAAVDLDACAAACKALATGNAADIPIYDMVTDSRIGSRRVEAPSGGLVMLEGLFAFEPELASIADMLIFLDVSIETRKSRRLERDIARGIEIEKILLCLRDAEKAESETLDKLRQMAHIVLSEQDIGMYWQPTTDLFKLSAPELRTQY
jgi:uridine kinase